MQKVYEKIELELILLASADIIATSGDENEGEWDEV